MDDMIAIGGLQGEMFDPAEKNKKKSKVEPRGYIKHAQKRWEEGYPSRRNWNEIKERKAREEFTRSLDTGRGFAKVEIGGDFAFDVGDDDE